MSEGYLGANGGNQFLTSVSEFDREKLRLLNLREENKVSESNIVESNMAESNMVEFKMAAIINLSQEWMSLS